MNRTFLKSLAYIIAYIRSGFSAPADGEAAVLMYHAVDESGWKLSIPPAEFKRQMAYLRRRHVVVPLADVVAQAKGQKRLPSRSVAVTFDDGYADLLPTVLPILNRYRVPITLFLTTDFDHKTNSLELPRISRQNLEKLAKSPLVTIESHGVTHRHLPQLPLPEVRAELVDSADVIERMLARRPRFFAYPYGDRTDEVGEATKECGYEAAFGITEGFVHEGSDLYRLPRIQVDATMTPVQFSLRLTPALVKHRRIVGKVREVLRKHSK